MEINTDNDNKKLMGVKIKLLDFVKEENANKSNETDAKESGV